MLVWTLAAAACSNPLTGEEEGEGSVTITIDAGGEASGARRALPWEESLPDPTQIEQLVHRVFSVKNSGADSGYAYEYTELGEIPAGGGRATFRLPAGPATIRVEGRLPASSPVQKSLGELDLTVRAGGTVDAPVQMKEPVTLSFPPPVFTPTLENADSYAGQIPAALSVPKGARVILPDAPDLVRKTILFGAGPNGEDVRGQIAGFGGWCENADGSGRTYSAGESYTVSADTQLYVKWDPRGGIRLRSVQIIADTGIVVQGGTLAFKALVSYSDGRDVSKLSTEISNDVTWEIGSTVAAGTSISPDGILTVASDETASRAFIVRGTALAAGPGGIFQSRNARFLVTVLPNSTGLYKQGELVSDFSVIDSTNISDAITLINGDAGDPDGGPVRIPYLMVLDNDILNLPPQTLSANSLTIVGIGGSRTISSSGGGSLFTVRDGAFLNLSAGISLQGSAGNSAPLVSVTGMSLEGDRSAFSMDADSKITGNTNAGGNGGAVGVYTDGSFSMLSGEISGNNALSGGGVFIDGGSFFMYGGSIIRNSASGFGGGVYLARVNAANPDPANPSFPSFEKYRGVIYGSTPGAPNPASDNSAGMDGNAVYVNAGPVFPRAMVLNGNTGEDYYISADTGSGLVPAAP